MKRLISLVVAILLGCSVYAQPKPTESRFFTTGEAIKPFKIKDVFGKKIETADWAGKTVVLNFWFIGCPPCRAEIPELNKLVEKYRNNRNVIFIAVALDDDRAVRNFVKQMPFNYRLKGDGKDIAMQQFRISMYPTNVVIDRRGKVRFHSSGFSRSGPYWIDRTIADSEAGK